MYDYVPGYVGQKTGKHRYSALPYKGTQLRINTVHRSIYKCDGRSMTFMNNVNDSGQVIDGAILAIIV